MMNKGHFKVSHKKGSQISSCSSLVMSPGKVKHICYLLFPFDRLNVKPSFGNF